LSFFSTRAAHDAHVMPPIWRSTVDIQPATVMVNCAVCTCPSTW
jgi:hypothetical protein